MAGAVGGAALWTSIFPADVIKSRMQIQGISASMYSVFVDIIRKEGPMALYNGLTPTICRTIPATAVLFLVYEYSKKFMYQYLWKFCSTPCKTFIFMLFCHNLTTQFCEKPNKTFSIYIRTWTFCVEAKPYKILSMSKSGWKVWNNEKVLTHYELDFGSYTDHERKRLKSSYHLFDFSFVPPFERRKLVH